MRREKTVGVIGGMGPEATVEFMRRLLVAVPANDDSEHLHVIADNNPKIPSRIRALIEGDGQDPTPVLLDMARKLENAGADFLVVPCNTAHHYWPAIAETVRIPVLDIVALTIGKLKSLSPMPQRIGILASPAVRLVGLFEKRLSVAGFSTRFPDVQAESRLLEVIRAVKAARATPAMQREYFSVASGLAEAVDALLVACTELSLLPAPTVSKPLLDTLDILVEETILYARG